jgi:hypothetical protein
MSNESFMEEIIRVSKSTNPKYMSIDFGKSSTTMTLIKGVDVTPSKNSNAEDGKKAPNGKDIPSNITKAFNAILNDKSKGFKVILSDLTKLIVPAKVNAGSNAKVEYPMWCCSIRSFDGTTDDLIKIPVVTVEKIMKFLGCIHPGDNQKYYSSYEAIPLVSKVSTDERVAPSVVAKYKTDIRWIAKEHVKKEMDVKKSIKQQKKSQNEESGEVEDDAAKEQPKKPKVVKKTKKQAPDAMDVDENDQDERDDEDHSAESNERYYTNKTSNNKKKVNSKIKRIVAIESSDDEREIESDDGGDASNEEIEEDEDEDASKTKSMKVDRRDYGELGIQLPMLHQNVQMVDPNSRVCTSEIDFFQSLGTIFNHITDSDIVKEIKENCVIPKEGIDISKKSPSTIKGAPTFTMKTHQLAYLIHYTANLEEFNKRQAINFIHNILKSTLKHEGNDVKGLLNKIINNSEVMAAYALDGLKLWALYDTLFQSPNSALSINGGSEDV